MSVNDVIEKFIDNLVGWTLRLHVEYSDGYFIYNYDLEEFYLSDTDKLDYFVIFLGIDFSKKTIYMRVDE